jgi:acyl-CoA synthetase (NDP forming)
VTTPAAAADAVRAIRADLESAGIDAAASELLVQEQVESGQEMIVGVNHDPLLGSLVMVGLGGKLVEVLGDVAVRIAPLTDDDIEDMLQSLKSYRLLTGYRGAPALDVDALRQVLHRVSALVDDLPEIAEMDLNPVFVLEKGAVAADVRIRLADHSSSLS